MLQGARSSLLATVPQHTESLMLRLNSYRYIADLNFTTTSSITGLTSPVP